MTARLVVTSGGGSKQEALVNQDHGLVVTPYDIDGFSAERTVLTRNKIYRSFLRNSSGSKNMNVDGSSSSVEFYISAGLNKVIFLTSVRILLNGGNLNLAQAGDFRRFSSASTSNLTNGITLNAIQSGNNTSLFEDPIKNTGDWFDYADTYLNFAAAISVGVDFLSVDLKFEKPIVLMEGSQDKLVMTIRDNLSSLTLFQASVRGYQQIRYT